MTTTTIHLTRQDVLDAFSPDNGGRYKQALTRPIGMTEIASEIVTNYGHFWRDPFGRVSRSALTSLLEEMATDRTLVMFLGMEWREEGVTFPNQRDRARYWTTRDRAEEWKAKREAERRSVEAAKRDQNADAYAKRFLAERHREEYDQLKRQFYAELDKESQHG